MSRYFYSSFLICFIAFIMVALLSFLLEKINSKISNADRINLTRVTVIRYVYLWKAHLSYAYVSAFILFMRTHFECQSYVVHETTPQSCCTQYCTCIFVLWRIEVYNARNTTRCYNDYPSELVRTTHEQFYTQPEGIRKSEEALDSIKTRSPV